MSTANWATMILLVVEPLAALDPMPRIPRLHKRHFQAEQITVRHRADEVVGPFDPLDV
jgi:hypothetical protein